jgi:hypothetical protein
MDQFAAGGGGVLGQIVLFAKEYFQAASGSVGGNAHAIDTATDHGKIVAVGEGRLGRNGLGHGQGLLKAVHIEYEHQCSFPKILAQQNGYRQSVFIEKTDQMTIK